MLTATQLRHDFGAGSVLDGIDLTLTGGTITCLLGPSGCGKSTLLDILAGLIAPHAGAVTSDIARPGPHLGYMSQEPGLLPWLTAAQNAELATRLCPAIAQPAPAKVQALLHALCLQDCANRRPHELSGGQQQRVALLRTLLAEPRLLLLDEPLGHLDVAARTQTALLLRHYVKEYDAAALVVTHQLGEAFVLGDRIVTLSDRPTRITGAYRLDSLAARQETLRHLESAFINMPEAAPSAARASA